MQDTKTGEMLALEELSQEAKDLAMPDRARQGMTLSVGEHVTLKGGNFKVKSMGRKMIVLEGLPGTKLR